MKGNTQPDMIIVDDIETPGKEYTFRGLFKRLRLRFWLWRTTRRGTVQITYGHTYTGSIYDPDSERVHDIPNCWLCKREAKWYRRAWRWLTRRAR